MKLNKSTRRRHSKFLTGYSSRLFLSIQFTLAIPFLASSHNSAVREKLTHISVSFRKSFEGGRNRSAAR